MYYYSVTYMSQKREIFHPFLCTCTVQKIYLRHDSLSLQYWSILDPRLTVVIESSSSSAISRWVFPATSACMILIRSSIVSISWGLNISSRKPSSSSLCFLISVIIFFRNVAWYDIIMYYYNSIFWYDILSKVYVRICKSLVFSILNLLSYNVLFLWNLFLS